MYTIMLVDDSRLVRRGLKNAIRDAGIEVDRIIEAVDGEDGLGQLEALDYQVDAVICDVVMPKMTGLELLETLASRNRLKDCPVIMVTGLISDKKSQTALALGATAVVPKPFTAESIGDALRECLVS